MITKCGFPGARLIHCNPRVLTPENSRNVGNSNVEFVVVRDYVCALPAKKKVVLCL